MSSFQQPEPSSTGIKPGADTKKTKRKKMSDSSKMKKLAERARLIRAKETPEQRAARLHHMKMMARDRRASETKEQTEMRLAVLRANTKVLTARRQRWLRIREKIKPEGPLATVNLEIDKIEDELRISSSFLNSSKNNSVKNTGKRRKQTETKNVDIKKTKLPRKKSNSVKNTKKRNVQSFVENHNKTNTKDQDSKNNMSPRNNTEQAKSETDDLTMVIKQIKRDNINLNLCVRLEGIPKQFLASSPSGSFIVKDDKLLCGHSDDRPTDKKQAEPNETSESEPDEIKSVLKSPLKLIDSS